MRNFLKKAANPLRFLINDSRATGIILLFCTLLSLVLANSGLSEWYRNIWNQQLFKHWSDHLPNSSLKWINDLFMSVFFLMAGMEIKRELTTGELSSFKRAVLPFGAALGGMVVPALIYIVFTRNTESLIHGWGIPTATDIAFSIGVASLFGKRVPVGLKILLMALAIIDDLGAIVVIALFYGGSVNLTYLAISGILYGLLWACNYFKVKLGAIQLVLSLLLWFSILNSGIEASITGVLVAFAMPINSLAFVEKLIHRGVNFVILPLFALANTAILFPSNILNSIGTNTASLGIIFGLVIGKPVGIFLFSRLLVALKIASLPSNIRWKQVLGMGALAGIGFTMSIFTTTLAFTSEGYRDVAKISILCAMLTSLALSWIYFKIIGIHLHIPELPEERKPKVYPVVVQQEDIEPEFSINM